MALILHLQPTPCGICNKVLKWFLRHFGFELQRRGAIKTTNLCGEESCAKPGKIFSHEKAGSQNIGQIDKGMFIDFFSSQDYHVTSKYM